MAIKNGQSRDTGNIGHTRHWGKTQHNTKQTKKMTNRSPPEVGMNTSFREG